MQNVARNIMLGWLKSKRNKNCVSNFFPVTGSVLELLVFLFHLVHMKKKHCIEIDDSGPVPICSIMIYNPKRRYEVDIRSFCSLYGFK